MTGDFDSDVLRLHYDSLTTPTSIIDHYVPTGKRATRKVGGGVSGPGVLWRSPRRHSVPRAC